MGLFGKKKKRIIDWSEGYKIQNAGIQRVQRREEPAQANTNSDMDFLGSVASSSSDISWDNDSSSSQTVGDYQERKNKVSKQLLRITDKIEEISNQIYRIQQRMEVIERKLGINYN